MLPVEADLEWSYFPFSGAAINNAGRLLWQVTVVDIGGSLQTVLYTSG